MSISPELENAINALRKIQSQAELNILANEWKSQSTFIGRNATRGMKKGDTVTWESRGFVHTGVIQKMNRKTTEIVAAGATPFGRTVTRVPNSMITGIVESA
tara:strand:+ start:3171 stop:3476 length:306 start_codon:yes stop_codon:yes gene_type:complete